MAIIMFRASHLAYVYYFENDPMYRNFFVIPSVTFFTNSFVCNRMLEMLMNTWGCDKTFFQLLEWSLFNVVSRMQKYKKYWQLLRQSNSKIPGFEVVVSYMYLTTGWLTRYSIIIHNQYSDLGIS